MSAPSRPEPLVLGLGRLHASAAVLLRIGAAFLGMLVLAYAGSPALAWGPAAALALPLGATVAASRRWGRGIWVGAAAGVAAALSGMGLPVVAALVGGAATAGAAMLCGLALRHLRFDPRLERARDVGALIAALVVPGVLPLATLAASWQVAATATAPGAAWWRALTVVALGSVACAVALLAIDRRLLHGVRPDPQRQGPVMSPAAGAATVGLMLLLLWAAPKTRAPWPLLVLLLPHVVAVALALRSQLALAAAGLLAAALLVGVGMAGAPIGAALGGADGAGVLAAAWFGSALAMMLLAHATVVEWRSRSQRWEWALDGTGLGVADWHLQETDSFTSAAWNTLAGDGGGRWSPERWVQQVHADDRAVLTQAIATLRSGEAGLRRIELRLPHGDAWRWTEATLMVIERDSSGQPIRLLATLANVQDRHEAQEQQRMSVSLFEHLHEGLLITDADLHALDVNPAYSQILGVPRDELIGSVPSLLRPDPADPVARQQRATMWASLRDSDSWRGELLERRRNGELCTLQATISVVRGSTHAPRYHVLVISDVTEQQAQRAQLQRQANFDELTRLPNRAHLSQLLDEAMQAANRDGYLLVVCYLDLDRFKPVNDRFGHAAGDRLLAELAGRLRSALRSREHWADSAARVGGDEFVLLLRAGTLEEARLAVERVLRVVSQPYLIDPAQDAVQVTASMGATVYPVDRSDADTLLRHADHAMYGAKQAGRNGYLFFDPEHRRRAEQRVMAIGRIQEALDQQEFLLYYQPKVDMKTGVVLGFEALLRWEHPQQGLVAPLQFLPLIENTGLSSRIGDWVVSQALEHLSQWRRDGLDFAVSVNISARHLQEPDFAQRLAELLARHADPLVNHLELEITESAAHADVEATSALLKRCRSTGVRFALDDFGTGYSTLTYLKQLPVDVLKIDRSFVHHMLDDAQDRAIVEGVIGLARTFGCSVVAEGVESPAQARALLEMGCDIGQGTGIAAPMPSAQVAGWVREYKGMFALAPAPLVDVGVARLGG